MRAGTSDTRGCLPIGDLCPSDSALKAGRPVVERSTTGPVSMDSVESGWTEPHFRRPVVTT
jgi:hypothetical protein